VPCANPAHGCSRVGRGGVRGGREALRFPGWASARTLRAFHGRLGFAREAAGPQRIRGSSRSVGGWAPTCSARWRAPEPRG
jgi:hypothetical protein